MKNIKNKKVEINNLSTDYLGLIITSIESKSANGMTVKQMRSDLSLIDRLNKYQGKDEIKIENDDLKDITEAVENMRWAVMDSQIVEFYDDLKK